MDSTGGRWGRSRTPRRTPNTGTATSRCSARCSSPPSPHPYRWGLDEEQATDLALDELQRMFRHEISPGQVACFLIEPVQGEGAITRRPSASSRNSAESPTSKGSCWFSTRCRPVSAASGGWTAADHYGIAPDIIALGKGIANGLPLSTYGSSRQRMESWPVGSHGTTFGGYPVACAAAIAVMNAMEGLFPHAANLSARLRAIPQGTGCLFIHRRRARARPHDRGGAGQGQGDPPARPGGHGPDSQARSGQRVDP